MPEILLRYWAERHRPRMSALSSVSPYHLPQLTQYHEKHEAMSLLGSAQHDTPAGVVLLQFHVCHQPGPELNRSDCLNTSLESATIVRFEPGEARIGGLKETTMHYSIFQHKIIHIRI